MRDISPHNHTLNLYNLKLIRTNGSSLQYTYNLPNQTYPDSD